MKELEALTVWNKLPLSQRAALIAALPLGSAASIHSHWSQLPRDEQKYLLSLDWNYMLGGKLGAR